MNYRPLYNLCIKHDYFDKGICRAIQCRIAEATLWNRRGLLFLPVSPNEWTILYDKDSAGVDTTADVLTLNMEIIDPAFVLYTHWNDFHPGSAYSMELPAETGSIEGASVIREAVPKQDIGFGFCQVHLRMTEKLFSAAQRGTPMNCTLQFHAIECQWEYLLVPRKGKTVVAEKFIMEETEGKLHFSPFTLIKTYGQELLRTVSEEAIPMREHYPYKLKVSSFAGNSGRKRIVLKHAAPPEPDKFLDVSPGLLRQVCNL